MPRGRRKQNESEKEIEVVSEVRESKEVDEIEKSSIVSALTVDLIDTFKTNCICPSRQLTNTDMKNIIALSRIINKYICNIDIALKISEKYIRYAYLSTGCLRIYSKKFFNSENVKLNNMDVMVEVKQAQPNVQFKLKAVYITYDLSTNETQECEILTI